jgi:hypothetical protein
MLVSRWRPVQVINPCQQVRELFAFVGQHTFGSAIGNVRGTKTEVPTCALVENKKADPIGG